MVTEQSQVLNCRMFCILISKVISRLWVLFIRPLVVCLSFLCRLWHLVQAWYGFQLARCTRCLELFPGPEPVRSRRFFPFSEFLEPYSLVG